MNIEQWERAKDILETALDLDIKSRDLYVSKACGDDLTLLQEVKSLLDQYDLAGSFLQIKSGPAEMHPRESVTFTADEEIARRFRVIRLIGRGGMGEVYEAEDQVLRERVALKTLLPGVAQNASYLTRFQQELQLARRITHPNVCRVHELYQSDEATGRVTFFTMEYLPGETLASLLKDPVQLSLLEIRQVIVQLAQGLDAAHTANVIHGDFKLSNIIILREVSGQPRAVITDFGLARLMNFDAEVQYSARLLGTLPYMAPELLQGEQSSRSSDIYAFGIVLKQIGKCYCASGEEFRSQWQSVVNKCLHPDTTERYAWATKAVSELTQELGERKIWPVVLNHTQRFLQGKLWLYLLVIVLLAGLPWFGLRLYNSRPHLNYGASILIPEVKNATADKDFEAIADLMRDQLGQSARFVVVDRSRVGQLLREKDKTSTVKRDDDKRDDDLTREVALRARSSLIIFTSVDQLGAGYILNLRVENVTDTAPLHWQQSFSAESKDDVFDAVQKGCNWFRHLVEKIPESKLKEQRLPQFTTTASWEALLLFSQAERLKAAGLTQEAIDSLEKSIKKDHNFSLAYMRLGDLYNSLNQEKNGFESWDKALLALQNRPVTQKEELRIRALYAFDSGDLLEAERKFRVFEALYPHEYLPSFYLADTLARLNRPEEALSKMKEAELKQPDAYYPIARQAMMNMVAGSFEDARGNIEHLRKMGSVGPADALEAGLDFAQGDVPAVVRALQRLSAARDMYAKSRSYSMWADLLSELGRDDAAIHMLREGIAFDKVNRMDFSQSDKWIALAYLHLRRGDLRMCYEESRTAVRIEGGRIHLLQAGKLLSRTGKYVSEASTMLQRLGQEPNMPVTDSAKHELLGEILYAQGHKEEALKELKAASSPTQPLDAREFLARVKAAVGRKEEADATYREILTNPVLIWQAPDFQLPGLWLHTLSSCRKASCKNLDHEVGAAELLRAKLQSGTGIARIPD